MDSSFYCYFEIRSDSQYSKCVHTGDLKAILDARPELREKGPMEYSNAPDFPWISIVLVMASEEGNYSSNGRFEKKTNLLAITGSKRGSKNAYPKYIELLKIISEYLKWDFIEEQDEEYESK